MSSRRLSSGGYSAVELLIVLVLSSTVAAIGVPMGNSMVEEFRLSGDAHGVSNSIALAKMAGAAQFTRARLFVDLAGRGHRVEVWRKTGTPGWVAEADTTRLSSADTFSAGAISLPPPGSQSVVEQPPACRDAAGSAIAQTACVVFNSRGIPIDAAGAPAPAAVIYLSGPTGVFSVVVSGTSRLQVWRISPGGGTWRQQ